MTSGRCAACRENRLNRLRKRNTRHAAVTFSVSASLPDRALLTTRTAIVGIRRHVHTFTIATHRSHRTFAFSIRTRRRRAGIVAHAAMVHVRLRIDARTTALQKRPATTRTCPHIANHIRSARIGTAPAMLRIGLQVDTGRSSACFARRTTASSASSASSASATSSASSTSSARKLGDPLVHAHDLFVAQGAGQRHSGSTRRIVEFLKQHRIGGIARNHQRAITQCRRRIHKCRFHIGA